MRMDTTRGETAAEWLARAEERDIVEVIKIMAKNGLLSRLQRRLWLLGANNLLSQQASSRPLYARPCAPVNQGRTRRRAASSSTIHINQELRQLEVALPQARDLLRPGGRRWR